VVGHWGNHAGQNFIYVHRFAELPARTARVAYGQCIRSTDGYSWALRCCVARF